MYLITNKDILVLYYCVSHISVMTKAGAERNELNVNANVSTEGKPLNLLANFTINTHRAANTEQLGVGEANRHHLLLFLLQQRQ